MSHESNTRPHTSRRKIRCGIAASVVALTACAPTVPPIDSIPLAVEPFPPVPVDSVRFADPAPDCPSVARLTAVSFPDAREMTREAIRAQAADLGANVLVYSTGDGGSIGLDGVSIPRVQHTALALRCP